MQYLLFIIKNAIIKYKLIYIFLIGNSIISYSQNDWANYLVEKDKGLMSIHINLVLNNSRPNYKNLLIVGTNYNRDCFKNGFPKEKGLEKLYSFSDSIATTINKSTKYKLVGIITYQCFGFDVYYVKDTIDLRKNIDKMIDKSYNISDNYVMIEEDKKWDYYYNIFPTNWPNDFFTNHEYLSEMVSQGDNLSQKRIVNHWINFKKEKRRIKYVNQLKKLGFSIDSLSYKKETIYPYKLQVSRKESVEPNAINKLTNMLKLLARSPYGQYDGWATEVILQD